MFHDFVLYEHIYGARHIAGDKSIQHEEIQQAQYKNTTHKNPNQKYTCKTLFWLNTVCIN